MPERPVWDKHSSLLQTFVNYRHIFIQHWHLLLLLLLLLPLVIFVNDRRFVFWHFVMFRSVLLPQAVVVVVAQVLGGADPVLDDVVGRRVDHRLVRLPATRLRALAAVGGNDLRRKKKNRLNSISHFFV
jgi:hypothetical protein